MKKITPSIIISSFGILASLILIIFSFITGYSLWVGIVILLSNITLLIINISKQTKARD